MARVSYIDSHWFERVLECIPGTITWFTLISPFVFSVINPVVVAYFIIAFDLLWMVKSFRLSYYLVTGYRRLHQSQKLDWQERMNRLGDIDGGIADLSSKVAALEASTPAVKRRFHRDRAGYRARHQYLYLKKELKELIALEPRKAEIMNPDTIIHLVIIALYNETRATLEPTVKALTQLDYDPKKLMVVIAYEERGGAASVELAKDLVATYGPQFAFAEAIMHPDGILGEVRGKGGNITFAGRKMAAYITEHKIDPKNVMVTTLDSDNRPSKNYFAHLSYVYATIPNRIHKSYQPVPMFYNNIWDVPAPMRLLATGSSFWQIMESMRPHRLRNFAAHSQSFQTLLDTDFWSVTSIVEDGHQYWRTYFAYDGDHAVVPLMSVVYQDAVLSQGYIRTFKAQYVQQRRWAWGVSDFPYAVRQAIKHKKISFGDKVIQIGRLFEGHFSWATAPLILTFVASLPLYLNHNAQQHVLAHQLPTIASNIVTVALVGIFVMISISLISLPPKPQRYRRSRNVMMVLQWFLLPLTTIVFSAFAATDAQTRLMLGKYLDFRVTEKATKD